MISENSTWGGGDEENTQPDIRRHVVQEQSGKGQVCHKSRHEGGGATDTLTWHITDRKKEIKVTDERFFLGICTTEKKEKFVRGGKLSYSHSVASQTVRIL